MKDGIYRLILVALPLLSGTLHAQKKFAVAGIPASLTANADAVIRIHEETYEIESLMKSVKQEHLAVTVFNEKGMEQFICLSLFYDKFIKLKDIEGAIYDAAGTKIQSLKKEDIKDYSNFDGRGEVTDNRQKYMCFNKKAYPYPYTIEFSFRENNSNGMFYPRWLPVEEEHVGIEKASFSVHVPEGIDFRYKEINVPQKAVITSGERGRKYYWEISHIPPMDFNDGMENGQLPVVFTAPGKFEVETYQGNASSWKDIGSFYTLLNKDRDGLPALTKAYINALERQEKDPYKKIEKIYRYMQSKTRYISIQLGIGGWQCIPASEVDTKGYGDCKALSNYMIALLKQAGVKAYPALILAGNNRFKTMEDFPSFYFNHVIVCVPLQNDTVWLECTSQTQPAGYLGSFTGNRKALLMTDDGGVLVPTIAYSPADNSEVRRIHVEIGENGDAKAVMHNTYTGTRQEHVSSLMESHPKEKQKEILTSGIAVARCAINTFSFSMEQSALPVVEETIEATFGKFIPEKGNTLFMTPHIVHKPFRIPTATSAAGHSFYLNPGTYNYTSVDTLSYHFSENLEPESLPQPVHIVTGFGEYSAVCTFRDHTLFYTRHLLLKSGTFPSAEYQNWIGFLKQINKSDKLKVVLNRK